MNFDRVINPILLGIIGVAALTTIFGRRNTPAVINSLGSAFSSSISASLGKGVTL
jgi:hypothetical protein